MRFLAGLILVALAGPAFAQDMVPPPPPHKWFALSVDTGFSLEPQKDFRQRFTAGLSLVRNWQFLSLTGTFDTYDYDRKAFGIQGELNSIRNGLGLYLNPSISTEGKPGVAVGLGFNMFWIENAVLFDDQTHYGLSFLLRIPLGVIAYALWGPRYNQLVKQQQQSSPPK